MAAKDGKLLSSTSSSHCKQVLDLEKEPLDEVIIFIIYFYDPNTFHVLAIPVIVLNCDFFIRDLPKKKIQEMEKKIRMKTAQKS